MEIALEDEFYEAMVDIYTEGKSIGYNAAKFIQMVSEYGGVNTAKMLINADSPFDGFLSLWKKNRLDLSIEAVIQNPKWKPLFSEAEIERARKRLIEYGYIFRK